ncbi:MAG: thiE1 [Firmicutes bacterium]|nr:thiE1 [Bacillota bacterium]
MLICVTHRQLCQGDFLQRIEQLAQARPDAVMLREKDLSEDNYERLARQVKEICDRHDVTLILHQNYVVAEKMKHTQLQLSMPALRSYQATAHNFTIGASVHSVDEAVEAQALGATYLVAGHIFATDCKKGVSPKGVPFLQQVCRAVTLPVFAIGGIGIQNVQEIMDSGAKGCCIMSSAMTCEDPATWVREFATTSKFA